MIQMRTYNDRGVAITSWMDLRRIGVHKNSGATVTDRGEFSVVIDFDKQGEPNGSLGGYEIARLSKQDLEELVITLNTALGKPQTLVQAPKRTVIEATR